MIGTLMGGYCRAITDELISIQLGIRHTTKWQLKARAVAVDGIYTTLTRYVVGHAGVGWILDVMAE
jgi:hypothetical protein